uniref:Uncharacterized protein n=1 Tax=Anguilla anguilla TaxID=7936 RepID=A0A0E9V1Z0_ANGAN
MTPWTGVTKRRGFTPGWTQTTSHIAILNFMTKR